jgi:hypothetical protein
VPSRAAQAPPPPPPPAPPSASEPQRQSAAAAAAAPGPSSSTAAAAALPVGTESVRSSAARRASSASASGIKGCPAPPPQPQPPPPQQQQQPSRPSSSARRREGVKQLHRPLSGAPLPQPPRTSAAVLESAALAPEPGEPGGDGDGTGAVRRSGSSPRSRSISIDDDGTGAVRRRAKTGSKRALARGSGTARVDLVASGSVHLVRKTPSRRSRRSTSKISYLAPHLLTHTPTPLQVGGTRGRLQRWDSGAHYELQAARLVENRVKARALEGRMMREQVGDGSWRTGSRAG